MASIDSKLKETAILLYCFDGDFDRAREALLKLTPAELADFYKATNVLLHMQNAIIQPILDKARQMGVAP